MNKCEYCGDVFQNYGFATHVRHCKKATPEKRLAMQEHRNKYSRNHQPVTRRVMATMNGNGKRLRLCVSIDLEQVKALLPYLEIDEVKIG